MSTSRRWLTALVVAFVWLAGAARAEAHLELRSGTIVLGVPRPQFVVLGADRLWKKVVPKPADAPWERQGQQVKIVRHPSLPLAVAAAGLGVLDLDLETVDYVRELITPLDAASLRFDAVVERLRPPIHEKILAVRRPARRALAANPADAEAKARLKAARLTLLVGFVAAGRATLGWIQIEDLWQAKQESPPHGAVAWPDTLDRFYTKGPFAGAAALFGRAIEEPTRLASHVRRVIEAGIREDARLSQNGDRQVGGPVDVVLIDARGARCIPPCAPP